MTREKAIQILSTVDEYGLPHGHTSGYVEAIQMAVGALKQSEWILCSERLPEESGDYLVTVAHHSGELWVEVDQFNKEDSDSPYQWWHFDEKVIAWMPRPEPYKGKEK